MSETSPNNNPLTPEAWQRVVNEALEHIRLNQQENPRPYPNTQDEEVLAKLD